VRQARLGLGGDKPDAPTDQHDKRYGCSGAPPQKTAPSRSTRAALFHCNGVGRNDRGGVSVYLGQGGRQPSEALRHRSRTWIPKFQHLNALFNWLDPDRRQRSPT
jgi:hypothetical protein